MKQAFLFAAFLLSLTLIGCNQPEIQEVTATTRVMAFGDSLTSGHGVSDEKSYPSILADLLGAEVINEGVSGEDSHQGRRRLPDALETHQPDLVVLCMGGNDMLRKQADAQTKANLQAMIEQIRASGADIVLIGVPKPGLLLRVPEFYDELAEAYELPFDGKLLKKVLSNSALKSDYIHPNEKGYRLMAERIAELIRDSAP
jgi:acyl-CoA thioesterase-1